MSETCKFEELFEIPLRNGLTKPKKVRGNGTKMVNMGELFRVPLIDEIEMERVPLNEKEYANSLLKDNDLLFARQSLVRSGAGQCSIFLKDNEDVCFESHIIRCRLDEEKANPLFYFYFFKSPSGKALMDTIVEQGAGASGIRGSDLAKLPVPLVDIEQQRMVAKKLYLIDKKIQLNTQINQTLEAMAQALFKSWFVDFDPVKAKAEVLAHGGSADDAHRAAMRTISGKTDAELESMATNHPENYAQLAHTASLFPDKLVDSELGDIPEGWEVGKLSDIATFTTDRITTEEVGLENYISTENMLKNKGGIQSAGKLPSSKTVPKFDKNHILISNIRPYFKKIWLANFSGGRSPDVLGFVSKNNEHTEFLYNLLYQDSFFEFMMTTSKGAKMPRGDKDSIMTMKIFLPGGGLPTKYSNTVRNFYKKTVKLKQQNERLAKTRDILLPKLLSGKIYFRDTK